MVNHKFLEAEQLSTSGHVLYTSLRRVLLGKLLQPFQNAGITVNVRRTWAYISWYLGSTMMAIKFCSPSTIFRHV